MPRSDIRTQAVTAHLRVDDYRLLKSYASLTRRSMNDVVVAAVREHLDTHATGAAVAALVEEHRTSLRSARS